MIDFKVHSMCILLSQNIGESRKPATSTNGGNIEQIDFLNTIEPGRPSTSLDRSMSIEWLAIVIENSLMVWSSCILNESSGKLEVDGEERVESIRFQSGQKC